VKAKSLVLFSHPGTPTASGSVTDQVWLQRKFSQTKEGRRVKCWGLSGPFSFPFYRESWYISQLFVLAKFRVKIALGVVIQYRKVCNTYKVRTHS